MKWPFCTFPPTFLGEQSAPPCPTLCPDSGATAAHDVIGGKPCGGAEAACLRSGMLKPSAFKCCVALALPGALPHRCPAGAVCASTQREGGLAHRLPAPAFHWKATLVSKVGNVKGRIKMYAVCRSVLHNSIYTRVGKHQGDGKLCFTP